MSKYEPLWAYIAASNADTLTLTFDDIHAVAGVAIDHSFLRFKKELCERGYEVGKISMKNQTVVFKRIS